MDMKMQRRDWLKLGVAGGLAWSGVQEALAQGLAAPAFASAAPELVPLQGLRGQDLDARDLQIEGRLPDGLRGTYYRNGPGLMARGEERYRHWFDGDGLVQAWTFGGSAGRAQVAHKARFVHTRKFKAEAEAGRFLLPAFGTAIPPRMAIQNHRERQPPHIISQLPAQLCARHSCQSNWVCHRKLMQKLTHSAGLINR